MNRQVPERVNTQYTIVGDGKVARHFGHYFKLLGISFNQWHRKQSTKHLQQLVVQSDCVLLLISDDAIQVFIDQHPFLHNETLVHFSGSLTLKNVYGCHPLMAFGEELYGLETYQNIPFVCDENVHFKALFPRFNNPNYPIEHENKAYYHAMCVMAGNFAQSLMRETANQLNEKLDLPADILQPYLLQNIKNFISNPDSSETGPIERGDFKTISKHLTALKGDKMEEIYHSFVQLNSNQSDDLRQAKRGIKLTSQDSLRLDSLRLELAQ